VLLTKYLHLFISFDKVPDGPLCLLPNYLRVQRKRNPGINGKVTKPSTGVAPDCSPP